VQGYKIVFTGKKPQVFFPVAESRLQKRFSGFSCSGLRVQRKDYPFLPFTILSQDE